MNDENRCEAQCVEPTDEDLKAVLREMKTYVDISMEDLKAIYASALRHARDRVARANPVSAVMTQKVVTVSPDADLHEVSRLLSENRVSTLPVVDSGGRVVGVVTGADVLAMAGLAHGHTIRELIKHLFGEPVASRNQAARVGSFMSAPAITVKPTHDIREAAAIIGAKRLKSLPVVDDEGRLKGIISRSDILKAMGSK